MPAAPTPARGGGPAATTTPPRAMHFTPPPPPGAGTSRAPHPGRRPPSPGKGSSPLLRGTSPPSSLAGGPRISGRPGPMSRGGALLSRDIFCSIVFCMSLVARAAGPGAEGQPHHSGTLLFKQKLLIFVFLYPNLC